VDEDKELMREKLQQKEVEQRTLETKIKRLAKLILNSSSDISCQPKKKQKVFFWNFFFIISDH